jgi:hypothetical protein
MAEVFCLQREFEKGGEAAGSGDLVIARDRVIRKTKDRRNRRKTSPLMNTDDPDRKKKNL